MTLSQQWLRLHRARGYVFPNGVAMLERARVQGFQKGPLFLTQGSSGRPTKMGPRALHCTPYIIASPLPPAPPLLLMAGHMEHRE